MVLKLITTYACACTQTKCTLYMYVKYSIFFLLFLIFNVMNVELHLLEYLANCIFSWHFYPFKFMKNLKSCFIYMYKCIRTILILDKKLIDHTCLKNGLCMSKVYVQYVYNENSIIFPVKFQFHKKECFSQTVSVFFCHLLKFWSILQYLQCTNVHVNLYFYFTFVYILVYCLK